MSKNDKVVSQLNQLLSKIIDAKKGYHVAAEEIDNPNLKGRFMSMAEQRENFRRSIREEIYDLGGEPMPSSTDPGFIQESFAQPDLLLILKSIEQTLDNCLQYELDTLTHYKDIFCKAADSTCNLVAGQRENIELCISDTKMQRSTKHMVA